MEKLLSVLKRSVPTLKQFAIALFFVVILSSLLWQMNRNANRNYAIYEDRIAVLETENDQLLKMMDELPPPADTREADPARRRIMDDLQNQIALVPIQSELGGTMRFFPELTKVLSEQYVYAYAEDGHVAADMLFRYLVNEDESINWQLVLFDTGNGWELNQ